MALHPVEEGGKSLGERAKEAANPISIELNRWKRLAEVTNRDLATMPNIPQAKREAQPAKKPIVVAGGLVNFPKYMLFENSHLKSREFQRFCEAEAKARQEAEDRALAAEAAMNKGEVQDTPLGTSRDAQDNEEEMVPIGTISWGQPRLRGTQETIKKQWAGSACATGKCQRSSN